MAVTAKAARESRQTNAPWAGGRPSKADSFGQITSGTGLKGLMREDAKEALGQGMKAKRSKSGANSRDARPRGRRAAQTRVTYVASVLRYLGAAIRLASRG
jgi:hypothetical protein